MRADVPENIAKIISPEVIRPDTCKNCGHQFLPENELAEPKTSSDDSFLKAIGYLILGLSPVGIIVPYFILSGMGICSGALGSGVSCKLSFISGYFKDMAGLFEVSCYLFGLCIVWAMAAVVTWLYAIKYTVEGIQNIFAKNPAV
ncbi:MAG: hypothetical protein O3C34_21210 [Proteobacteria bacterium]|nr:hypothetical protein [Pseudomonadota bacterium]